MTTSADIPTAQDAVDAGIRNGLSLRASLRAYRALGGAIRTDTFAQLWRRRRRALRGSRG